MQEKIENFKCSYFLAPFQFPLPHSRGSSHGQSRGIRASYPETHLRQMVGDARVRWRQLEAKAGTEIIKSGTLYSRTKLY